MAQSNRTCFTCGSKYGYCPDCYEDRNLEAWHIMFHNENCKNVFDILNKHFYNHITTEEAIKQLNSCDLTVKFNDDIRKEIDNILTSKKVDIKPTEDPVVKGKK
jgi:predicted nucleic-acid-binding Zn-ribbon protein